MVCYEVRVLRLGCGGKCFAVRFETPPGEQAKVDFAQFRVRFTTEPDVVHIVWLFSIVLGYSRLIWGGLCSPADDANRARLSPGGF